MKQDNEKVLDALATKIVNDSTYVITPEEEQIVVDSFKSMFSKGNIIREAKRDGEKPFGPVITWLRDYFHIPKSKGCKIADRILAEYNIDNEAPLN